MRRPADTRWNLRADLLCMMDSGPGGCLPIWCLRPTAQAACPHLSLWRGTSEMGYAPPMVIHILAVGIGIVAGLRSLTAPAAVSWAARLGWLSLGGTGLAWMGSTAAVVLFSLLATAEYIADLLPQTPRRTMTGPLVARILMGGLCGASLYLSGHGSWLAGAVLGGVGGVVGAFAGYEVRKRLVGVSR